MWGLITISSKYSLMPDPILLNRPYLFIKIDFEIEASSVFVFKIALFYK